jgi:hypothetical protein
MVEKTRQDDHFGLLTWEADLEEWRGTLEFPTHGRISIGLPPDSLDDHEIRAHILSTLSVIERDEQYLRTRAADELYATETHLLFWPEDQPFERDHFIQEMRLVDIVFDTESSESALTLGYEYGDGMEQGIIVTLTWDGDYCYTGVA